MKLRLAFLLACVLGVGSLLAQPAPKSPGAKTAAPAKSPAKKEAVKKEEPKIEGTVLNRPDGTFLGLTLQDGKYKLSFYDKDKKPMPVNVLRGVARWPNPHGPGQNRTVLNRAGDGTYLLGALFVRGPHSFRLMLTLVKSEDGQDVENYAVDFRG
ncbi:MAG: hypothetical protein KBC32_02915 [Candidatus Didemnitutus sp.]|nr:hypothetical protein [Candidatus Didemnitutus sp.]